MAASARPNIGNNGIIVSVGPMGDPDSPNKWVKNWMTFPVTPESVPKTVSAQWSDGRMTLRGGETAGYIGRMLERVSFAGRLEPPRFYWPTEQRGDFREEIFAGMYTPPLSANTLAYRNSEDQAVFNRAIDLSPQATTSHKYGYPVPYFQGGTSVVMQDGAHAGPSNYVEPHIFSVMLENACTSGEVVRLVIGDQYGWNFPATIREYSPRFEDPDPDVLLYEITFTRHREQKLNRAKKGKPGKKTKATAKTRNGDTLHIVAARELGSSKKWQTLLKLNRKTINALWYYPSLKSIGKKISGRTGGYQVGKRHVHVSPTLKLRAGVELKLRKK